MKKSVVRYGAFFIYLLPKYLNVCFLYSSYSPPNILSICCSSCKICRCNINAAHIDTNTKGILKNIRQVDKYSKSKPTNAGFLLHLYIPTVTRAVFSSGIPTLQLFFIVIDAIAKNITPVTPHTIPAILSTRKGTFFCKKNTT